MMNMASAVYINAHRLGVRERSCHWALGETHDAVFTCTHELAMCNIFTYLGEREGDVRRLACEQTVRTSRSEEPGVELTMSSAIRDP
jgi:hypothetical protein